jgi:hypothetical protein
MHIENYLLITLMKFWSFLLFYYFCGLNECKHIFKYFSMTFNVTYHKAKLHVIYIMDAYYIHLAKRVPVFSKACKDNISSHGYRHFDFETVGAKIYRCMIALNQTLTGKKKNKRVRKILTYRLVIVESGLRQCKMRNGYVKKINSELSVCFESVHDIVLYLNLYLILNFCRTQ